MAIRNSTRPQSVGEIEEEYVEAHAYDDRGERKVSRRLMEKAAFREITDARDIMLQITRAVSIEQARELAATFLEVCRDKKVTS